MSFNYSLGVHYRVTAEILAIDYLEEYVEWLKNGHVQAVCDAGATHADVSLLDDDDSNLIRVVSAYIFPSREALEAYFKGPAITLREEGVKLFVETGKIRFSRTIGDILYSIPK